MRKTLLFIVVLLAFLTIYHFHSGSLAQGTEEVFIPSLYRGEWSRWLGPDGGNIVALAISPTNPQIMYAGTWGAGVFKSTNGGASWSAASNGLTILTINALAVDPNNPNVVYAGPYRDKLYKSVDGGQSWAFAGTGIQDQAIVYGIAIDPSDSDNVYIGTRGVSAPLGNGVTDWNGRLYRSTNGGTSWIESLANVNGDEKNQDDWAYAIVVDPSNGDKVYAAMHLNGVYQSTNSGVSWQPKNGPLSPPEQRITDLSGRAIVISRLDPSTLYYGVWHRTCVYKTDNAAVSWTHQNNGCGLPQIYNMALYPLANGNDIVYLATFNFLGVIKTDDGGITWESKGLSQDNIYSVAVPPNSQNTVFAGTQGDGLYRSTNGGDTWVHYQSGISNATVASILVQPEVNKPVYAVVPGSGVTRLLATGQPWQDYNLFLPYQDVSGLVRHPVNSNKLFAYTGSSGLYYTDLSQPAQGWLPITEGLPSGDLLPPLLAPDHPFASREDLEAEVEGPLPEIEFDVLSPMGNFASITALAFAPSNPNRAYITTLTSGTPHSGVYRSDDGGLHWENAGLDNHNATALAVSPLGYDVVYVATSATGVVFYTNSAGINWQETSLPTANIYTLAFAADGSRVYAGTNNGVYVRVGEGSWTFSGLGGIPVTALATNPAQPGRLYVGTTQGVYMSGDAGASWRAAYPELSAETIQSIGIDPLDPHFVYLGTKTRGIVQVYFP